MQSRVNIVTLENLIKEVMQIDNNLYELELKNQAFTALRYLKRKFKLAYKPNN